MISLLCVSLLKCISLPFRFLKHANYSSNVTHLRHTHHAPCSPHMTDQMTVFPAIFGAFAVTIFLVAIIRIFCIRRWMYNRPVVVYSVVTETNVPQGQYYPYNQPQGPVVYGQPVYGQPGQPGQPVYGQPGQPGFGQQPPMYAPQAPPPQQVYGNAAYAQPQQQFPQPPPQPQQSIY